MQRAASSSSGSDRDTGGGGVCKQPEQKEQKEQEEELYQLELLKQSGKWPNLGWQQSLATF